MRQDATPSPRATRGLSIRWKLTLVLAGATLIPMSALTIWDAVQGRRDILALTDQRLLVRAQTTAEAIEAYLSERQRDAGRMSQGPVLRPFLERGARLSEAERRPIRAGFESHRRAYGYLRIALLTPDGAPALSVGESIASGGSLSQQAFREALAGRVAVSDPFFAGPDGPYVLEVAAPVSDASGTLRGAILFALPFAGIAAIVQADPGRAGPGSTAVLLDRQMIRIAHAAGAGFIGRPLDPLAPETIQALTRDARFGRSTRELVTAPTGPGAFARELAALRQGGGRSTLSELVPLGSEKLGRSGAALLQTVPWIYYVAVPYDTFLAPARAGARRNFIVLAVATAGCALLAWGFGGLAARRLENLADTTERLAAGDFAARTETGPPDEIGRVARSFNLMAGGLEANEAAGRERVTRLEALTEIGRSVTSSLALDEVLSLVVERGVQAMGVHAAAVFAADPESGMVRIVKAQGLSSAFIADLRLPPGLGLAGVAMREGQPVWIEDVRSDSRAAVPQLASTRVPDEGIRAALVVPIPTPSGPYGVLALYRRDVYRFEADQIRFATLLADQAGITIENARLFGEEQARRRQLEAVRAVTEEITRELDLRKLLGLITRRAADLLDAPAGALYLWDEAEQFLVPRAWHGIGDWLGEVRQRPGEGMAGVVAQRRTGIRVNDYATWEFAVPLLRERTGATAILGEPLLWRDRLLGVILIINLGTPRHFSAEDSRLLSLFSAQAAIAIQNARLVEHRSEQMVALSEALRKLVIAQPIDTFFRDLVEMARQAVGARYGALGVLGADGRMAEFVPAGLTPEETARIGALPLGRGLLGHMLKVPHPLRLEDLGKHPQSAGFPPHHPPMGSFLGARIVFQDRVIGALYLTEKQGGTPFTEDDERLVEAFAANAAVAIANARAYQEVQEARRELEAKTKELEAFTYTVSHDLKAPLRGIDGFSRALQEDYGDRLDAEGVRYLENVRAATHRMDDLIEDLLKYSRLERRTIRQSRVDLAALCQSILEDRRPEVEARRLTVRLSMAVPQIDAEPEGLREAVANLVDNAIKFSKPGGTISVSSAVLDGVPRAGTGAEAAAPPGAEPAAHARHVVMAVQDEGIGFDMKYHDRIFEIFQRLHRAEDYEGTGVGLAIVKKVAERHGGRAWAASEPGQGSTFYLAIPQS